MIPCSAYRCVLPFLLSGVQLKTGCSGNKPAQNAVVGPGLGRHARALGDMPGPRLGGPVLCDVPSAGERWGVLYKAIQPPSRHISQHVLYGKYCLHLSLPTPSCNSVVPCCNWILALINYPCTTWRHVKYCMINRFFSLFYFTKIFA